MMIKNVILFIAILIAALPLLAKEQALTDTVWTTLITPYPSQEYASAICFSPDGKTIAAGTTAGNIYILKTETGEIIKHFGGQYAGIYQIIYSPNGKILATRQGKNIFLWDIDKSDMIAKLTQEVETTSIDFSNDGNTLMFSLQNKDTNNVRFLDVNSMQVIRKLNIPLYPYYTKYSNNNNYIAVGKYNLSTTEHSSDILLWDAKEYKQIANLGKHFNGYIGKLEFSFNDKFLVSVDGGVAKVWNIQNKNFIDSITGGIVSFSNPGTVAFSKDAKYIVTGNGKGYLIIWDAITSERKYSYEETTNDILDVQISNDNKYILTTFNHYVGLVNARFNFDAIKDNPDEIKEIQISNLQSSQISIKYFIPHNGLTTIKLYNISGNTVQDILSEQQTVGENEVKINCSNLSPGVYFCRITNGNYSKTVKLIINK